MSFFSFENILDIIKLLYAQFLATLIKYNLHELIFTSIFKQFIIYIISNY